MIEKASLVYFDKGGHRSHVDWMHSPCTDRLDDNLLSINRSRQHFNPNGGHEYDVANHRMCTHPPKQGRDYII